MEDLRTWIKNIAAMGELKQIDGAHWDLEIGVLVKLSWVNPNRPALIFDNIVDYPAGFRVLTGSTATAKRVAHTFNIPQVSSTRELVQVFNRKYQGWKQNINEFRPKEVTSGPILENILSGKDVNLYRFPAPKWHEDDGGRFIGTGCAFITQDPDTGETNLGTYRMQLHDEKTAGVFIQPGHHGRMHIEQYHARKKACPVAVSLGHNPLVFRIASAEMKAGAEYGMIGAVHGKPVDVIKEEITGLLIPANSEIVIAGWCQPNKMKEEGPFGEWTGYYGGGRFPAPVIDIERIYYRNNPILVGSPPDRAPNDSSYYLGVMRSSILQNFLEECGVPDVAAVWVSEEGGTQLIIVSIKQRYAGHAKQAAILTSQSAVGTNQGRYVIVVDEDIDPINMQEVLWAVCTRSDPEKDIDIIRRARSNPLDTMIRKPTKAFHNSVAIIDACKPYEWKDEFPQEIRIAPELEARVKGKWPDIFRD